MKTKIAIKSIFGNVLFEHEADNNTVKKTLEKAVEKNANLAGANLARANLAGANLAGANLADANLTDANLAGANLRGAKNIPQIWFDLCRDDLWAVLSAAPNEVSGLRKAIIEGRINGSAYEGECACLVGTIANVRGCNYQELEILKPNASRPIEQFFINIKPGDIPKKNKFTKLAVEWIDDWTERMTAAFGK